MVAVLPTTPSSIAETELAKPQIDYIPNEEFDSSTEQDFVDIDFEIYEGAELPSDAGSSSAHSFLLAVEQSRLLTAEGERFLFKRFNFLRFRARAIQVSLEGRRKKPRKSMKELERLIGEAEETREQIACANLRLVTSIVRRISQSPDEFEEFLAEANAILLHAIDKFDYGRGYRFCTYATHAVQRHLYRLVERARKRRDKEANWTDDVEHSTESSDGNEADKKRMMGAITSIIESFDSVLEPREQQIVRSRFGLDGTSKAKSMRVIGEELGLSKERVRQLLNGSLEKLAQFNRSFESLLDE